MNENAQRETCRPLEKLDVNMMIRQTINLMIIMYYFTIKTIIITHINNIFSARPPLGFTCLYFAIFGWLGTGHWQNKGMLVIGAHAMGQAHYHHLISYLIILIIINHFKSRTSSLLASTFDRSGYPSNSP